MDNLTTSEFRGQLKTILDRVNDDHQPVSIRRAGGRGVVVMDADDYASIQETLYLVRNPANAERLRLGMKQHQNGQTTEIDIDAYLD